MRKTDKLIAEHRGIGVYDLPYVDQLVQRGKKFVLYLDYYGGEGTLHGGMYRQTQYAVADSLVDRVKAAILEGDTEEMSQIVHDHLTIDGELR